MKELIISLIISVLLLCQGCVPLHIVEGSPDEKTLASIKADTTNKEDVLMMLGEPDRVMMKERFFQYWWTEVHLFVGGWLGGVYGYVYSLHIYFDENNVVKKVELRKIFGEVFGEKQIKRLFCYDSR